MPAIQIEATNVARDVAKLVSRVTTSTRIGRTRSGVRVIGGGIIAAIVVGVVIFIAVIIIGICLFRRHKSQSKRRQQEMGKYYGGNGRSSIGTDAPAPAPGDGNNNTNTGYGFTQGYGQGQNQGYGYAHMAQPGQAGYVAPNNGGVAPMAPAYTADHVTHTK
ncbi:hypothetical protein BDP81DRAFT_429885 [Colletotrichum phormii]|uniref:Uncharacterized protein n=1 Tax=Colletotrichum phormii TaxID=359342 RepID=A0AAJ0EE21_9PEZI|nr:uncharacterized protein BDP81DRAFT_429885 [Colletotrichum phormii]KAK1635559.1 hypothetical protein BDP81DRAFT_429885 [Colletotrichum phormii]